MPRSAVVERSATYALEGLVYELEQMDARITEAVVQARLDGASWQEIGEVFGITGSAAGMRYREAVAAAARKARRRG